MARAADAAETGAVGSAPGRPDGGCLVMADPLGQKRILLFWPVFAHVLPAAFQNFLRLSITAARLCPEYKFDPWVVERASVHGAMNMAVDVVLSQGHDYLIAFEIGRAT